MPSSFDPNAEQTGNAVNNEGNSSWVMLSLEADQLSAAKARHYPRRRLGRTETAVLWVLRVYVLFMLGVVCYQVWTGAH